MKINFRLLEMIIYTGSWVLGERLKVGTFCLPENPGAQRHLLDWLDSKRKQRRKDRQPLGSKG
jgi:hypothetical protein